MSYLKEVKQLITDSPIKNLLEPCYPCSLEEVQSLEQEVGLKLPAAYKEFLLWAGKGLGTFEVGSEFFYDQDLVDLQRMAKDLLEENNAPFKLPEDAFVFWGHQGYQFTFFRTSEGNNPPVHYYIEGSMNEQEEIKWNYQEQFTDFLIVELKNHIQWQTDSMKV